MRISFAISTVPREPFHIHNMVDQLVAEGFFENPDNLPLRLVSGSPNTGYLERYRQFFADGVIAHEGMTPVEAAVVESFERKEQRVSFNAARCLGGQVEKSDYVLMLQDDLRFAKGWIGRLRRTIEDVRSRVGTWWGLALFVAPTEPGPMPKHECLWARIEHKVFTGAQALLFPSGVAHEFAKMLVQNCFSETPRYDDLVLRTFCAKTEIKLLATVPSLIQHVGEKSTIGNPFFISTWFREPVA